MSHRGIGTRLGGHGVIQEHSQWNKLFTEVEKADREYLANQNDAKIEPLLETFVNAVKTATSMPKSADLEKQVASDLRLYQGKVSQYELANIVKTESAYSKNTDPAMTGALLTRFKNAFRNATSIPTEEVTKYQPLVAKHEQAYLAALKSQKSTRNLAPTQSDERTPLLTPGATAKKSSSWCGGCALWPSRASSNTTVTQNQTAPEVSQAPKPQNM